MTAIRGEFIRGDGLKIPNNITRVGCQRILNAAFNGGTLSFWLALVRGVYAPDLTMTSLVEPTIGTNGYARQPLLTGVSQDWNSAVLTDDGAYVISDSKVFTPVGGAFDEAIQRLAIVDSLDSNAANVVALSNALPSPSTIDLSTAEPQRTFAYRVYL